MEDSQDLIFVFKTPFGTRKGLFSKFADNKGTRPQKNVLQPSCIPQ